MVGSVHHPPGNSFLFAPPPSNEAGPSEPNSHGLSENLLQRLREENVRLLRENEGLIKTAEEQLQQLEEQLQAMKARDAAKEEEGRIWNHNFLQTVKREIPYP